MPIRGVTIMALCCRDVVRTMRRGTRGSGAPLALGDCVETPMHPVREVHVRGPRRREHAFVAPRASGAIAVGGRVVGAQVRLGLDDAARSATTADLAQQDMPQKSTRDLGSRSRV